MLHRFVLHNGRISEASACTLSAGQVGLLSGWGIFSTLRIVEGVPFAFERHWARMSRDAALLHIPLPPDPEAVRRGLLELIEANQASQSTLRLVIVRNSGGMWEGPGQWQPSDVIALTAESKHWGASVKLSYVPHARHAANSFAGAKMLSWAPNLTWLESAQARGFDEVVLLNERGEIAECTSANIFVARGGEVWTPPLTAGCLPGITREVLLEEIRVPGIRIAEKVLMPADLETADEVFITSTTRNLIPVVEVEQRKVGGGGVVCAALDAAFAGFVQRYVTAHKETPAAR